MTKKYTAVERLEIEAVIKRFNYSVSPECCDVVNTQVLVGKTISIRHLFTIKNEMLSPRRTKKAKITEQTEVHSVQQFSDGGSSESTPAALQIDLTGKSQTEILTLTIDKALARLVRLVSADEQIAASTLTKIVSDLTDAYRKLLSIPQEYLDAMPEAGRLLGFIQRANAERPDDPPETLRSFFKAVCDNLDDETRQIGSGETVASAGRTVRNPEWSSLTAAELVEELLSLSMGHEEWREVTAYIHERLMNDKPTTKLSPWHVIPRRVDDALPDLLRLVDAISPIIWPAWDVRPSIQALTAYVKANGVPGLTLQPAPVAPPEPDAELDPIVSVEALSIDNSAELDDQPDREVVLLAEAVLSDLGQQEAQQGQRNEIARKKRTGEWHDLQIAQQRALNVQAGYDEWKDVIRK